MYRLVIIHDKTPGLLTRGPQSLNTTTSKVLFYVFQVTPEFLAALSLLMVNVRKVFGTGMWGDYRQRDPGPEAAAAPK